ncbi:MAG: hypothetical protein AB1512_17105 [Thermodesulfobacteriota bacterium]
MQPDKTTRAKLYVRYPLSSVLIYDGSTVLHFLLGGAGILLGYGFSSWAGYTFGILYLASLILPILAMVPALFLNFSAALLDIFLGISALLLFRFFVIFPKIACLHCCAKHQCPQAGAMGVRDL